MFPDFLHLNPSYNQAYHELSKEEYEGFMRWFHPAHPPRYDREVARTKRQAGQESFEFNSEEAESGDWGDWGPPSACSRTCGGGVSTEERTCSSGTCSGPDKRFASCSLQDCPRGSRDFRQR